MELRTTLVLLSGLTLGLFFVLLELLKAARSSQWAAMSAMDWAGAAIGLLVYASAAALLAGAVQWLLRDRLTLETRTALGFTVAGTAIWIFLSMFREETPTPDDGVVVTCILGIGILLMFRKWVPQQSPAESLVWSALIFGTGILAIWQNSLGSMFAEGRANAVTVDALMAMVFASIGLSLTLSLPQSKALRVVLSGIFLAGILSYISFDNRHTPPPSTAPADAPNLVLIISDTLRADYLARYGGSVPTPHIDALAENGAEFSRAYSLAPWTFPSMYGLFASRYPKGLSSEGDDTWLEQIWRYVEDPGGETLAEKLRDKGYRTAAMSANALLWGMPLATRGFDTLATAHPILLTREGPLRALPFLHDALAALLPAWVHPRPHDTTLDLAQYAGHWLDTNADAPFFLYMHYIDPHAPYDPPERYRNVQGPWPFFHPYAGGERWGIPQLVGDFAVEEEDRDYVRDLYKGEIQYVDEFVGRLLDHLDRLFLRENTVVAFTSDHGEELWDHGGWGHGQSLHEELLHVPLILSGPGIEGQRRDTPVSAIDLSPTLAELMGVPRGADWQGESYADALANPQQPIAARPIFAQGTSNKCWPHPQQAVIAEGFKLIRHAGSDTLALYDLQEDPGELRNVASAQTEQRDVLFLLLEKWLDSFESTFENRPADDGLSGEAVERLEGMGYL